MNRVKVGKPGHGVRPGDILTLEIRGRVYVWKIVGLAARRGPASQARRLYQDQAMPKDDDATAQKEDATGPGSC